MIAEAAFDWAQVLSTGGGVMVLGIAATLFFQGKLHGPKDFDRCIQEKDEWKNTALDLMKTTQRGVTSIEKIVEPDARLADIGDKELMEAARARKLVQ